MRKAFVLLASFIVIGSSIASVAVADETEDMINNAVSAGPAALTADATVYTVNAEGAMVALRDGTNGWWCMGDDPTTPTNDPMCGDENSMDWVMAWIGHTDPTPGKVGLIYMLQGGSDSNNLDPYAAPPEDGNWVTTGPHLMVMNATDMMVGYTGGANPDTTKPYIMYDGTPYAHLMIPVQ